MHPQKTWHTALIALLFGTMLLSAACAALPTDPAGRAEYERINDPLEPTNRVIFSFNTLFQNAVLRPLASIFNTLPEGVHTAVGNFFTNLAEPRNIANALLQGDPKAAGNSLGRFLTNSTFGLGGLVAAADPTTHNPRDFGQTLARWFGGNGAYLELPFLGASSLTGGMGTLVDSLYSIPRIQANRGGNHRLPVIAGLSKGVVTYSKVLPQTDDIYQTSPDPYITFRNIAQQRRQQFVFAGDEEKDYLEIE